MPKDGARTPLPTVKPKILYFVTEDWYFYSHRLALAAAARAAGYEVAVVTRVREHGDAIRGAGLRLVPMELSRGGRNPLTEWVTIWRLFRILRRERPDLVHNVALKPVLYGTIAARLAGISHIVNALAGLGHLFGSERRGLGLLRGIVTLALRWLLNGAGSRVIVQNPDDLRALVSAGALDAARAILIRGSGVDLDRFRPAPEAPGVPVVVLAARLLWDKGVGEFCAAAERLRTEGVGARFVLVGDSDEANLGAIPRAQLELWQNTGTVEWWGKRSDMPEILSRCHLFCLPSYYGEGVPKALLEAAAAGRPVVTTDMPGCREAVRDGVNGLLVPPKDVPALAEALKTLLLDSELRGRMGKRGREIAEAEFGVERVIGKTLALYRTLLA